MCGGEIDFSSLKIALGHMSEMSSFNLGSCCFEDAFVFVGLPVLRGEGPLFSPLSKRGHAVQKFGLLFCVITLNVRGRFAVCFLVSPSKNTFFRSCRKRVTLLFRVVLVFFCSCVCFSLIFSEGRELKERKKGKERNGRKREERS